MVVRTRLRGPLLLLALVLPLGAQAREGLTKRYAGEYRYTLYVPEAYSGDQRVPLVVMLHGCWQGSERFAKNTGMDDLADQHGFLVAYPEQPFWLPGASVSSAITLGCWRWFAPENQSRSSPELARIAGIVDAVSAAYAVDPERVYAAGISAGGAMAVNLGVVYPDKFAAIGVGSGLAYRSATTLLEGFKAMRAGGSDPESQGRLAYQAMGRHARVVPVIVLQGAKDPFVAPLNAEQVITQWAQTNDLADDGGVDDDSIDATPDAVFQGIASSPQGHGYTVYAYHDGNGRVIMKRYLVAGMGHAWSGGVADPSWVFLYLKDPFVDSRGPDASEIMWEFFSAYRLTGPGHGGPGVARLPDAHAR